ncbi:MAG TPA: hypothetical protein VEO95_01810 [Chthoniobacteraceae bacterium]|nr:hypothetical protein [Chthoniobacteraceae bacterium]
MRLHTAGLIHGVERRDWRKVEALLADDYSDRWSHDKAFVVTALRQVFQPFIFLTIEHRIIALDASTGRVSAQVKMSGQGGPAAQFVMAKVNGLGDPFTFTWQQHSRRPWDWQLTSVDHPTLEPDIEPQF